MEIKLGAWYKSPYGRIVLVENFAGPKGVRVCIDNNITEIINKEELESEWILIKEENSNEVKPGPSPPPDPNYFC